MNCMEGGCGVFSHQPVVEPFTRDERDTEITRLHGLGFTDPQIGDRVGLSGKSVYWVRKRLGLETGWLKK